MLWPEIPYEPWRETCSALHIYTQIVGKYRLARTPWVNHSWHATLYVNARGFTTSIVPDGPGGIEIAFDLIDHVVVGAATDGRTHGCRSARRLLQASTSASGNLCARSAASPISTVARTRLPAPVRFEDDHAARPYDAARVTRFFQACVAVDRVLKQFRTSFLGKVSPVHLFWGSFDLAVTRFSGRSAPPHPGGIPALPDNVTREAYSHRGIIRRLLARRSGAIDFPAFYSYAYPAPEGFAQARVAPDAAYFDRGPRRIPAALRGGKKSRRSRSVAHVVPGKYLSAQLPTSAAGTARRWNARPVCRAARARCSKPAWGDPTVRSVTGVSSLSG